MVIVYNCLSEFMVRRRITTNPPPSTVSTVLASKFGVKASKSWKKETLELALLMQRAWWGSLTRRQRGL